MAHQSGLGHGVGASPGPGGSGYSTFDPRLPADAHLQAHMQPPHSEHFPPTSPIFTGASSLAGSVTPSCTTPPMGTTSIPRYPLRSPTMFHGDQRPVSPSRNVMDPNMQLHYQYPGFYRGRRPSYSEESPITSSTGGTPHVAGYIPPPIPNVPSYPSSSMTKRSQPAKGTRRNPGLRIDFSPAKGVERGPESHPVASSPYPSPILRPPTYQNLGGASGLIQGNVSEEVKELRRKVAEFFYQNIELVKKRYQQNLQELFFLQHGGNIIDFPIWKRRPTPQWDNFHATHKLEDDVDFVAPSTPLGSDQVQNVANMDYITLQHKLYPGNPTSNMVQPFGHAVSPAVQPFGSVPNSNPHFSSNPTGTHIDLASSKVFLSKDTGFGQTLTGSSRRHNSSSSSLQSSISDSHSLVFKEVSQSKEDIMLEARKEAEILKRVGELRKEGLWSAKRLPKVQEPSRTKAHWDYVIEEMTWLATDFAQERRWKKGVAKKLSRSVLKYHQDIKAKEVKAEKESTVKLQRIASSIAKEVRQFWINIDKLVHYKVQSRMEEKRKKALDVHLNFIVGQTEKYSSWLAESLKDSKPACSIASSLALSTAASSPMSSNPDTGDESDFDISEESDDEETLDFEEAHEQNEFKDPEDEIKALQEESEIPLDDLIESLPVEMFAEAGSSSEEEESEDDGDDEHETVGTADKEKVKDHKSEETVHERKRKDGESSQSGNIAKDGAAENCHNNQDEEFIIRDTMVDVDDERTLDEEEKLEEKEDHQNEISVLEEEGELPIEELLKKYNMDDEDDLDEVCVDQESEQSSDEVSSEEDEEGMAFLLQSDTGQDQPALVDVRSESPNQELTDAAATAESLQPTGYTLETTKVKTPIPFLLRGGTLREYQYIGLDWLVTMYEKCLNGILADEMGLGKTIMTIAVLAHLACEKGSWGPHLIVVPTSVMLNWEMEFKKWCPGFKILTYYGNQKERKLKRTGWTKPNAFHVCITSYKLVVQDHQSFRRKKWKYLILDEAQNIKNFKSQRWQYLLNFNSQHRLLLTGTPLQNNLMELWSLMHFLMPHLFESHKDFKEWFSNPLSGMIEGSSEYNENLVKRLHKILRPFLLRRLKSEVEKQMPQKYEHIVRCRLSKRQRILYDDFMSQSRTKETLESGHLLSVINILMQLRKVCNHPDLFEPRPTVTSLKMSGVVFTTASLVVTALDRNPLNTINFAAMNLILTQLEYSLSAFAGHRVKQLQTPRPLITEVDTYPEGERPFMYTAMKTDASANSHNHVNEHLLNHISKPGSTLHRQRNSTPWSSHLAGDISCNEMSSDSTSIRLYPDADTLYPGFGGRRYITPGEQDYYNALRSPANSAGSTEFRETRDSGFRPPLAQVPGELKPTSSVPYNFRTLPRLTGTLNANELKTYGSANGHVPLKSLSVLGQKKVLEEKPRDGNPGKKSTASSSPFTLASLEEKQYRARQHKLRFLAAINERRCMAQPVYGQDLVHSVTVFRNSLERTWCKLSHYRPSICETLQTMTKPPQERVDEMKEIVNRFVFAVPAVVAPRITMHVSHPPPSHLVQLRHFEETLTLELSSKMALLHPIVRGQLLQFPEVRLIQYDCGKLQTLDLLLRKLKAEKHRVLIFTQMTKMLDVLERFLNYHGYLYLRLDGTTRVEQRQVLMERFNNDRKIFCFILSTRSGGVGVNLTGADTVIFYDSDWNPTMDAQAQDRCHRIGQTRDVHIYRLICEKTVEENILKKAHQKKLLGDIAIEGGNFTTTVLKETTVRDLFTLDSESDLREIINEVPEEAVEKKNTKSQNVFEQALMKAEDEQDVKAASLLKAEQDAELDEFDENIPLEDENSTTGQGISKVEEELRELESQLSAVERYAVHFVESSYNFVTAEQVDLDQKTVELSKKDWELEHIQAIKEEEERRAAEEEDEILYVTYPAEESRQVKKSKTKSTNKLIKGGSGGKKKQRNKPSAGSQGDTSQVVPRPTRSTRRTSSAASSRSSSCS